MRHKSRKARELAHAAHAIARWSALWRVGRLLWTADRRDLLLVMMLAAVQGPLPALRLALIQQVIDQTIGIIQGRLSLTTSLMWLGGLFVVIVIEDLVTLVQQWLGGDIQERLRTHIQALLLNKASRLSLASFELPASYDHLRRAQEGIDTRLLRTFENLMLAPARVITLFSLLIYVSSAGVFFPIVLLIGLIPLTLMNVRYLRRSYVLTYKHTETGRMLEYLSTLLTDRQTAAETRLFGLQQYLVAKRADLFGRFSRERIELANTQLVPGTLSALVEQLTYGLVIVGVVILVVRNTLTLGYLASYLGATERFRAIMQTLLLDAAFLDNDLHYIQHIVAYLDAPDERSTEVPLKAADSAMDKAAPSPEIRFEQVSFSYPGTDSPVLREVNLIVQPGERIALVGLNGAGKSTLIKLLLGLYQPTSGQILFDGRVSSGVSHPSPCMAAVFQDYMRYAATVRENIGFGRLSALYDDQAIYTAAHQSHAAEIIEQLPSQYETQLGKAYDPHGRDLSHGQWQRLAIARAYISDSVVLVLDEPTAALDAKAEVEVYQRFSEIGQGRTVILIAHRLGCARLADRILVIENGQIIEEGCHAALVARAGRYAEMYAIQAEWYQ